MNFRVLNQWGHWEAEGGRRSLFKLRTEVCVVWNKNWFDQELWTSEIAVTNCDYLVIVAKGKSQGGRVCKKGTRNDACGGETMDSYCSRLSMDNRWTQRWDV